MDQPLDSQESDMPVVISKLLGKAAPSHRWPVMIILCKLSHHDLVSMAAVTLYVSAATHIIGISMPAAISECLGRLVYDRLSLPLASRSSVTPG